MERSSCKQIRVVSKLLLVMQAIQLRHHCILKLENEHYFYVKASASKHRQRHNSMELLELWTTVIQASNCTDTRMFRPSLLFEASWDNRVKHRGGEESGLCLHSAVFAMADSDECKNSSCNCSGDCR